MSDCGLHIGYTAGEPNCHRPGKVLLRFECPSYPMSHSSEHWACAVCAALAQAGRAGCPYCWDRGSEVEMRVRFLLEVP